MIEAIVEGAEVQSSVLPELEGLVRTLDQRLEVGQYGVDPLELRQITRLEAYARTLLRTRPVKTP